ncbi:hypothetical protein IQ247_05070 [Plectonema cf. radiosum LEGE 06105]|uniref:Uncharacterized protein n=1 Tax=Plectonema cf. radiosum LEGE 06105 TaxID=945769 RepID=A0A8J7F014_9CYAN|nr:hypothetical protein [Plectonema radiosum]MBE9212087.1 hypothetical protein [Plectonema cf. radiosum LEGE 06105]
MSKFTAIRQIVVHLKPPGDPHQICTQIGGGRMSGLIAKRPLSEFVR